MPMIDPLIILVIGIVTVIGMIIVLRVNAFIALITAAMLVSLLSAGDLGDKITRVATAFGDAAGKIGIVIALAAVIGKCLMDSGAADKIVRSFLRAIGEKRASVALLSSGFVLSIPVFFDTVFYLLVPLARSLYRRTNKDYMLYILAIGAGAAITHTLVPPTPGPLMMASYLGIDIGMMMMVGLLVSIPTAAVALLLCKMLNWMLDIPMRSVGSQAESEPLSDDALPSFWIAILPVVLPVILISTDTVTKMFADAEHAELVAVGENLEWSSVCETLRTATDDDASRAVRWLWEQQDAKVRQSIDGTNPGDQLNPGVRGEVQGRLHHLVEKRDLVEKTAFVAVPLQDNFPKPAKKLMARGLDDLSEEEVKQFNWLLLETALPGTARQTAWRSAAGVTGVFGNPNFALLLSATIAMVVLVRQRGLTLVQLAQTTEEALMSGGVIILITAGGGAFGAMLRMAGVENSITGFVGTGGESAGVVVLLLGFGVAAVMKIAQGSSTVSMMVTAAMFAAMGITSEKLGCNVVYLATAIGGGSLVGSWMNDSGFWIFTRMSGLTEIEGLKAWSTLLVMLGFTSLGFTLLFSQMLRLM
jgi:gluconate:H+ symporter, GntP family